MCLDMHYLFTKVKFWSSILEVKVSIIFQEGKVEIGEKIEATIKREVKEETGIEIEVGLIY